jgi:hypothetical protein
MITIEITEEVGSNDELVRMLRHIADLIEQGNTSGYNPTWTIDDPNNREFEIEQINEILTEWGNDGELTAKDLELSTSPVYNSIGEFHIQLVEKFSTDGVTINQYFNDEFTNDFECEYEDLEDELISEIYTILYDYKRKKDVEESY